MGGGGEGSAIQQLVEMEARKAGEEFHRLNAVALQNTETACKVCMEANMSFDATMQALRKKCLWDNLLTQIISADSSGVNGVNGVQW
jgi:hypothetical protein